MNDSLVRWRYFLQCHVSDLIEISDVDRDRNIGRIAVIEEMLKAYLRGNIGNHLAEPRYLQILDLPDLDHERAEIFADKTYLAPAQIDAVEMVLGQHISQRVTGGRERVGKVEKVGQVPPQHLLFECAESKSRSMAFLHLPGTIGRSQSLPVQLLTKPMQPFRREVMTQEFHGVGVR